jgi:putative hydrolase of the HAD superfamily
MGANRWDAVIFDYGRVLSHSPTPAQIADLAALVGLPEPPFFQLYSDTRDEYDCGLQDCHGHWQKFARAAGVSLDREQIDRIVEYENRMWLRANPHALELAREIRSCGLRAAILSNMPPDLLHHMRNNFAWLPDFEVQVWSCEHGFVKPDPRIYSLCLDRLGCEAQRTLFFDDRPRNVEGARRAGMEAHVFESAEQAAAIVRAGLTIER